MIEFEETEEEKQAREKFEAALTEYMSFMEGEVVMLTGYVFKGQGMTASAMEKRRTVGSWGCGIDQNIFTTIGLGQALSMDIDANYAMADHGDED